MSDKLVFAQYDPNQKGFLKRQKRLLVLNQRFKEQDPDCMDEVVELLLAYTVEPTDKVLAAELIWDMSEAQFKDVMAELAGGKGDGAPPLVKSDS